MLRKIWVIIFLILLVGFIFIFFKSPFIHSSGVFAEFERARSIPALIFGIIGTVLLLFSGWFLLGRGKGERDEG